MNNKLSIILLSLAAPAVAAAQQAWSIDRCVSYALEHATEVKRQRIEQKQAGVDYNTAILGFLPQLSAQVGGQYNWGGIKMPFGLWENLENYRYEGWYAGAGLVYGYQWLLGKRWSIEAALGLGYVRAHYDKYECVHCGEWMGKGDKNYLGVTKAAVSLIYIIK